MTPERMSVPTPCFAMPMPALPPMTPPSVTVLPLIWMIRLAAPSVIAPVFWVRLAVPVNSRLPPKFTALVIVAATVASRVPPLMLSEPAVPPLPPKA